MEELCNQSQIESEILDDSRNDIVNGSSETYGNWQCYLNNDMIHLLSRMMNFLLNRNVINKINFPTYFNVYLLNKFPPAKYRKWQN